MTITRKQEAEIMKAYHHMWQSYLQGDMKTFAHYLHPRFQVIGTAEKEVFRSKRAAVKFYTATASQVNGVVEMRNRDIGMTPVGDKVLIDETCQVFVRIDGKWIFYGTVRLSTLFTKEAGYWQNLHQHGSFPDTRAADGEQFASEKIKKENLQLKEAVHRRTVELQAKTRELEIETALEKVRAVAMGMQHADDMLDICQTISEQLEKLGVKEIRNVQTAIFYPEKGTYMNYEYYARHHKTFITDVGYKNHRIQVAFARKMMKGANEKVVEHLNGVKLKEWYNYQKTTNQFADKYILSAHSLNYYWYSLGPVALGISTYFPLTNEEQQLFNRFLHVFELAYRRYLDIEKAEKQAREAQIEAALERVRSAAMAMKHSAEIGNLIHHLYGELTRLDARLDRCFIMIVNPENLGITWWMAGQEGLLNENGFFVQYNTHPSHLLYLKHWKNRQKKWQYLFEGKEKRDWDRFGFSKTELAKMPQPIKDYMTSVKKIYLSGSSDQFGCLITGSMQPLAEEHQNIISRFAIVFNQTYTRFLDLQKAEEQAREAQIEAALERVRSRSMAMHNSQELKEVIRVVLEQLVHLNINVEHAGFYIDYKEHDDMHIWLADPNLEPFYAVLPYFDSPTWKSFLDAKTTGKNFYTDLLDFKTKNKFYRALFKIFHVPDEAKKFYLACKGLAVSTVLLDNVGLYIENFSAIPYTDEENRILMRFGKVFQQTYTRFLDLQKAEAQAREAQIEVALERIRARALAMHSSEELTEVAKVMREQMVLLGQPELETSAVHLYNEDPKTILSWRAFRLSTDLKSKITYGFFKIPKDSCAIAKEFMQRFNSKAADYTIEVSGAKQTEWYKILFDLAPEVKAAMKKSNTTKEIRYYHFSKFSGGALLMVSSKLPTSDTIELQRRSAQVFDLAYRRYKDLQKAESQAREAQIEASLEKVRARSLAMQTPGELIEVAKLLRTEMGALGVEELETGSIYIMGEKDKAECWYAIRGVQGNNTELVSDEMTLHLNDTWVGKEMQKFYQSGKEQVSIVMKGQQRKDWINYCAKKSKVLKGYYGKEIPERTYHLVKFPGGYLGAASPGEISTESWDLLKRAAIVFSLAYTRFKDLQDAEARAQEARIELALERVRARSLAMHHTSELQEVVNVVAQQLLGIGIDINGGVFIVINEEVGEDIPLWASAGMTDYVQKVVVPFLNQPFFIKLRAAFKKPDHLFIEQCNREEKTQLFKHLFQYEPWKSSTAKRKKELLAREGGLARSIAVSKHTSIAITDHYGHNFSEAENEILKRFAKVFEQSYIRFLDLQKAEKQAREAQIEAALEKVRSRSLAMHNSGEIKEVVKAVFEKMKELGFFQNNSVMIVLPKNGFEDSIHWTYNEGFDTMEYDVPAFNHPVNIGSRKAWKRGDKTFEIAVNKESKDAFLDQIFKHTDYSKVPNVFKKKLYKTEAYSLFLAFEKNSALLVDTFTREPYSEEQKNIVKRFATVFEQAYIRFLDLQKAEAQAREAQIEAALERVRAKAMAMHSSKELSEVVHELRKQMGRLGQKDLDTCVIHLLDESPDFIAAWAAMKTPDSDEAILETTAQVPKTGLLIIEEALQAYAAKKGDYVIVNEGEKVGQWMTFLQQGSPEAFEQLKASIEYLRQKETRSYWSFADFTGGSLLIVTTDPPHEDTRQLLRRFANVFGLAYRRFADLKQAEAQAREAEIQLALERVRARSLAMHKSEELSDLSLELVRQVQSLGVATWFCAFNIYSNDPRGSMEWGSNGKGTFEKYRTPREGVFLKYYEAGQRGETLLINEIGKDECPAHYEYLCSLPGVGNQLLQMKASGIPFPSSQIDHVAFFKFGYLLFISYEPVPESHEIFKRFARVFEQSYTRFLDLQKAEKQAREAEIQLALERVRARTMAMQKSEELAETAAVLFQQVKSLGIESYTSGFTIWEKNDTELVSWMSNADGSINPPFHMPAMENEWHCRQLQSWRDREDFVIGDFSGEEMQQYYAYLRSFPLLNESFKKSEASGVETPSRQVHNVFNFAHGNLLFITLKPVPESYDIFKRFAKTFEQSYTRFLDLQKAEAQARESQIEAALERVRSRTMGMQKSTELNEVAFVLIEQIRLLGGHLWGTGFALCDAEEGSDEFWFANEMGVMPPVSIPNTEDDVHKSMLQGWKQKKAYLLSEKGGDALAAHYEYLYSLPQMKAFFDPMLAAGFSFPHWQQWHAAYFSKGYLLFITTEPYAEPDIFKRFAKVFDQTYTRFLDLQKAEAQAREAQVEAALEKVRSRTMAMQKSNELQEAASMMFQQIQALNIPAWSCGYNIFRKEDDTATSWMSNHGQIQPPFQFPLEGISTWVRFKTSKENGESFWVEDLKGDELKAHYDYIFSIVGNSTVVEINKQNQLAIPTYQVNHVVNFSHGNLLFITYEQVPEAHDIFKRFAAVFEQTYTRFLDLQKAEAQAREAQIEASLERVRSRSIAMNRSEEIAEIAGKIFSELRQLDLALNRVLIWTFNENEKYSIWWSSNPEVETTADSYRIDYNDNTVFLNYLKAWQRREPIHLYTLSGATKKSWEDYLFEHTEMSRLPAAVKNGMRQEDTLFTISIISDYGIMMSGSHQPLSDDNIDIIYRFGRVFQQSYTRYLDVQKAEAQAREAQIEAALEKVRSRTLAMQKSDELAETAAIFFQQLIALGIAPNRLFIILTKEGSADLEAWVTDEDGSKVSMGFTGNYQKNQSLKKMYEGWAQQKKSLVIDMQGEELQNYFHYLHDELKVPFKGGLDQKRRIQHLAYFSHGMIGMASPEEQPPETLQLMERFAAVFNLTFTRFNDLKIAEAHALQAEQDLIAIKEAKQKAEEALSELQATQMQLVQAEKMASLGELTAGIAHEIQNPLNFVNNFSEVSADLLQELVQEMEKGNTQDAKEIAEDLVKNLEKIHHHGERAASIVKGMLQHSRSSSGQKELTDINALCDEYLRLAYHGLRAKDKSFNAKFETSFDDTIEKISVMPQELGRVMLNLINNAFYATSERKKHTEPGYEPCVTVSSKREADKIFIRVQDNGTGIPKKVVDKIFQPFFTTKPTGLGTGLGLSLSYDIITKGHGGELKVETKEGEGTAFIIQIPI